MYKICIINIHKKYYLRTKEARCLIHAVVDGNSRCYGLLYGSLLPSIRHLFSQLCPVQLRVHNEALCGKFSHRQESMVGIPLEGANFCNNLPMQWLKGLAPLPQLESVKKGTPCCRVPRGFCQGPYESNTPMCFLLLFNPLSFDLMGAKSTSQGTFTQQFPHRVCFPGHVTYHSGQCEIKMWGSWLTPSLCSPTPGCGQNWEQRASFQLLHSHFACLWSYFFILPPAEEETTHTNMLSRWFRTTTRKQPPHWVSLGCTILFPYTMRSEPQGD